MTTDIASSRRSFFDPFGQSYSTRQITTDAIELAVKPIPASYPAGTAWLPAKRLSLHEEWDPDVATADIATPLTRTIFLWADGLVSGHLPALKLVAPDGLKLYPDQAQNSEQDTATGFTAVLQQKFAVIASQAGTAEFATVEVPWWNTTSDRLEIARLPQRSLTISAGTTPSPPPTATSDTPEAIPTPTPMPGASAAVSPPPVGLPLTSAPALPWPAIEPLWPVVGRSPCCCCGVSADVNSRRPTILDHQQQALRHSEHARCAISRTAAQPTMRAPHSLRFCCGRRVQGRGPPACVRCVT